MSDYQLVDIILFIGLAQGVFLTLSFFGISSGRKNGSRLLAFILLLTTAMLMTRIIYIGYYQDWMLRWSLIPDTIIFVIAPLLYAYLARTTFRDLSAPIKLITFIPFFLYLFFGIYSVLSPISFFNELNASGQLDQLFYWIEGIAVVFNFYFMYLCLRVLKKAQKAQNEQLSYRQSLLRFLRYFVIAFWVILLVWTTVYLLLILTGAYYSYFNYNTVWIAITVNIFVISYLVLKKPELLRFEKPKTVKNRIDDSQSGRLQTALERLFMEEKLYREGTLSLQEVAERLGTSPNDLSWMINHVYKQNFYDFVNGYRLEDFKERVIRGEYEQKTILALAYDSGFNSKTTFNTFFKQKTNLTPSAFIKQSKTV